MEHPPLAALLELAPEVAHEHVDDVRLHLDRVPPHEAEELVAGEHLPGMARGGVEQPELAAGEPEVAPPARRDVAARVHDEVLEDDGTVAGHAAAAQERLEPRGELGEREWLDEVVIGSRLQAADAVLHVVARGEDADRDLDAARAHAPDDAHAVEVGHRHVEDDRRGRAGRDGVERGAAPGGRLDGEALEAQRALEGLPDGPLVVDDEDQRLSGGGHAPQDAAAPSGLPQPCLGRC